MRRALRNVAILGTAQALFVTGTTLVVSASALVGAALAPDPRLATLPAGVQFLAAMATAFPASLLMQRIGRRPGFMLGAILGGLGGGVAAVAIATHRFGLFCVGTALLGSLAGVAQFYRFAAADAVAIHERPRAISLVLAGGLAAAFLGPNLASWTRTALPSAPFAGSFASLVGLQVIALGLLSRLDLPPVSDAERRAGGRPLTRLVAQPKLALAVFAAMVAYGVMNTLMTATPLAMHRHHFDFGDTASVIQWHAVGMFAPAFFTGRLIQRWRVYPVMLTGSLLLAGSAATNLLGSSLWHYWIALAALGVGWNFLFVSASVLVTETYRPEEKARVQGLNDVLVFATVTVTAVASGALFETVGWQAMNWAALPFILAVTVLAGRLSFGPPPA